MSDDFVINDQSHYHSVNAR